MYIHTPFMRMKGRKEREREREWMCDKFLMKDLKKHSKNERYKDHPRGRERERERYVYKF